MKGFTAILGLLFGLDARGTKFAQPEAGRTDTVANEGCFQYYNTFNLKDGHLLASELEKLELPFEVEFDDGIEAEITRFGNHGNNASMTLYIEAEYRDILDDLVRLHFH